MDNQEAIKILGQYDVSNIHFYTTDGEEIPFTEWSDAIEMAISALQEQDSKTRRICDTCKHNPPSKKWPCVDCDMREPVDRWEPQEAKRSTESSLTLTQKGLDTISRQAAIDAECEVCQIAPKKERGHNCIYYVHGCKEIECLRVLPPAQPEWNNHTVACLLAELFDDTCACNYNGIDEWLPEKCELLDSCPNPVGVACWEQYLKHREERRTGGN